MVNRYIDLKQMAKVLNLEFESLRELNPMYRKDIVPGTPEKGYPVRMPVDIIPSFIAKSDTIYNHNRENLSPKAG